MERRELFKLLIAYKLQKEAAAAVKTVAAIKALTGMAGSAAKGKARTVGHKLYQTRAGQRLMYGARGAKREFLRRYYRELEKIKQSL